ncbi:MAG TPA: LacI family DNA-binding transcriptional regulator [Gaiellales bacterium]|nr:LacI family DNA-binding transcriptional regulator [Gaiellales bacterium]
MSTSGSPRRRPTIYDVARLAGVSTATVSRALNGTGQVAEAKRIAIEAAVEQLGYRPNTIARSLVTRSTQTIALLLPDITNPFYAELVAGIHELTLERGYTMLLCTTDFDPEQEERYLRLLRGKHVDGALVDGLVLPPERIARFVEDGFPIVCLDRDVDSPAVPLVQVDNRMGAGLATDHLLALGHRRIAHITGAPARISEERLLGYQAALTDAGIATDSALIAMGNFTEGGGHEAMSALLAGAPDLTAVFAANDLSAIGALSALAAAGRKVPGDISLVGFDDVRLSQYTSPPLTTVRQPAGDIARRATELLLGMIDGRKPGALHHRLTPELIVRESTASPS